MRYKKIDPKEKNRKKKRKIIGTPHIQKLVNEANISNSLRGASYIMCLGGPTISSAPNPLHIGLHVTVSMGRRVSHAI